MDHQAIFSVDFNEKLVALTTLRNDISSSIKGRVNLAQSGFFGGGKLKMKARFEPVTSGFAGQRLAH